MAITILLLLAEPASPAGNVERDDDVVSNFEFFNVRADLLYDSNELVSKGGAYPGIRNATIIKVEVRSADARAGDADNGVFGVFNMRNRLSVCANAKWSAVSHC
jgi:hypothetical protein